jgi:uncharacterized protein YggE
MRQMRKVVAVAVGLLVLTMGAAWADGPPAIHATGTATVKVIPDTVRVQCTVRAQGKDAADVVQEAQGALQAVRDALEALKLPGLMVTDTGLAVSARPDSMEEEMGMPGEMGAGGAPPGGKPPTFLAVATVAAEWQGAEADLHANAAKITAAAVAASGGSLVMVTPVYSKADDSAERAQAWEQAFRNAAANAQTIARGLGVTISGYSAASMTSGDFSPESLIPSEPSAMEQYVSRWSSMFQNSEMPPPEAGPTQITVTAYVDATYK